MSKAHTFKLGKFSCAVISDGASRTMSLAAVFPAVSKDDLHTAKDYFKISTDDIEVGYNVLFIDTGLQKVLIDTGLENGDLVQNLAEIGINAESIDTIFITHGDSDHVGGMLNFPNARFIFPTDAWTQWTNPESRQALNDQFIHLFANMRSKEQLEAMAQSREKHGAEILAAVKTRTNLIDIEYEAIPGIKFIAAPGHRSDHFAVEISSEDETLIHVVDSIRHPFQTNYAWPSFIDSFPEQIVETNKLLVGRILEKKARVMGAHFPFPALAKLSKKKDKLVWEWQA